MTKRKANGDPKSKRKPKKPAALGEQNRKPESPAARAYRHIRAAKSAHLSSDASGTTPEMYDLYSFPPKLPSPPLSTRQTPPTVPRVDSTIFEDNQDATNDTQGVVSTPTVSGLMLDESTLLDILCFHCDDGLTDDAFDAIMQHAVAAAKPGDEFGILFMNKFISDLADMPINQQWLAEIIGLLQQNLDSLCDRLRGQIRSLGKLPLPDRVRLELPVANDTEQPCDDGELKDFAESIQAKPMGKSTNDLEDVGHQDNTVLTVRSKHSDCEAKDTRQGSQAVCKQSSTTQELTVFNDTHEEHEPHNTSSGVRQPEAPMDSVYDLFVRSATEANCFTTEQNDKAIKRFNKRVRRAWARMESEPRVAWVKLFNARPDSMPLMIKGKKLLWSQGLHAKLFSTDCEPGRTQLSTLSNCAGIGHSHIPHVNEIVLVSCPARLYLP